MRSSACKSEGARLSWRFAFRRGRRDARLRARIVETVKSYSSDLKARERAAIGLANTLNQRSAKSTIMAASTTFEGCAPGHDAR